MAEKLYIRFFWDEVSAGDNIAESDREPETLEELKENYIDFVGENDHDDELFATDDEFEKWSERVRNADMEELRFIMAGFDCDLIEVDDKGNAFLD